MNASKQIWFKLFACCVLVQGTFKSLVYDLERNKFYDLPNDYISILNASKTNNLDSIENIFKIDKATVKSFFDRFVEMHIGFYTVDPESFPEIDFTWYCPNTITNSIIEYSDKSVYSLSTVIKQLNYLSCVAVQIRLLTDFSFEWIKNMLFSFEKSSIKHIELILPHNDNLNFSDLLNLIKHEPRLNSIFIYASPKECILLAENENQKLIIQFTKDIRLEKSEIISNGRFVANIKLFSESQRYNVGLNRKVCIDDGGEIKNYISHEHSYGNIDKCSINDIVNNVDFNSKWTISNDEIEVCKNCQYRYSCVSNSDIYIENSKYYKNDYCDLNIFIN